MLNFEIRIKSTIINYNYMKLRFEVQFQFKYLKLSF